jgi:HAD superfamily hydrolase (TIGR01544 family)
MFQITKIVQGGRSNVQVITDFDYTLSYFWDVERDVKGPSSHGIIEKSGLLSSHYHDNVGNLFKTYYPIEIDHTLSEAVKTPLMLEWWNKAHDLMMEEKLTKQQVKIAVKDSQIKLRIGYETFFRTLKEGGVPLCVFSAGIGDIIYEVLLQHCDIDTYGADGHWAHIVSNKMVFDADGVVVGFNKDIIHIFNKFLPPGSLRDQMKTRKNVILMGDGVGDTSMANGLESEVVLKIGYLNDRLEDRIFDFIKSYDVVLMGGNGSLEFVQSILDDLVVN